VIEIFTFDFPYALSNTSSALLVYTNAFTPTFLASSKTILVPSKLTSRKSFSVFKPNRAAIEGMSPAVWNTISGLMRLKREDTVEASVMLPVWNVTVCDRAEGGVRSRTWILVVGWRDCRYSVIANPT